MAHTVFITGSNRGIGLEFTKQYAVDGWKVFASCRHPEQATELQTLCSKYPKISLLKLDITHSEDIKQVIKELGDNPIDLLIHNAGIPGEEGIRFGKTSIQNMLDVYETNALAPLKLTEALIKNIASSHLKRIVYLSSILGSLTENTDGELMLIEPAKQLEI